MTTGALIVCTFALALFWMFWRSIRSSLACLEDQEIEDFLAERLGPSDLKRVREHLLQCDECKERLDEMTRQAQKRKPDRLLKRRF